MTVKNFAFGVLALAVAFGVIACSSATSSNDSTPSLTVTQGGTALSDNTYDFGTLAHGSVSSGSVSFTIKNNSSKTINLTGSPNALTLSVSSGTASDAGFNIDSQPSPTAIGAGSTATFSLSLIPSTSAGEMTATVSIPNDSSDTNPLKFTVKANRS